jgi:alkylated DNA repair dioxygenase AlkB
VQPWTTSLLSIRQKIEKQSGLHFTSVLLNRYRSGLDSVSWHRDNEKVLRVNPVIASVSFGAARIFKFRHIDDHTLQRSVLLTPGTFVLMKNETQHFWEHAIPKSTKTTGERISLTFRILY